MAVDQEIAVRGVFVLADARFDDGRVAQGGEAATQIIAHERKRFAGNALDAVGINGRSVTVAGDFDAAVLEIGHAVNLLSDIEPSGKIAGSVAFVSRRRAEEINFLARRENPVAEKLRENPGQPGAASENVIVSAQTLAAPRGERLDAAAAGGCFHFRDLICAAGFLKFLDRSEER